MQRHHSILLFVGFVPQHYKRKLHITQNTQRTAHILQELLSPVIQTVQTAWIGNVVHQHGTIGAAIEAVPETLKAFLTRRVCICEKR